MKKRLLSLSAVVVVLVLLAFVVQRISAPEPVAQAAQSKPLRIVSTTPSVTGILLAMNAPLVASAATTPSRLSDAKGFFTQWADVADQRGVQVLYKNLVFDIEAVVGANPDLLVISATGADSVAQHQAELQAQGIETTVVNYSNQSWQEMATALGKATGLELQASEAIKRFDDYAAATAARIKPGEGTATVVGYNIGGSYSVGRASSPQARVLQALGFNVVDVPAAQEGQINRSTDFAFISRENLSAAISGDSVFLMGGTDADVQAFLADPVLANLPAVINKRVYALGPSSFRIDYYSGMQMIDAVARHFL
ncbi:MAG: Fe2+-enterobactin ABC transporter substrate-binding protein [Pseudomonas sp.]